MEILHVYPQRRVSFPEAEVKFTWLKLLLDAYSVVDEGVDKALEEQGTTKNRSLACRKGCANCCRIHAAVPVYPLEMAGMAWYCTEQVNGPEREVLIGQLDAFQEGMPCPFLVEDDCAIHLVRPMACRQFNVFDKPCEENEDPFYTRRDDVLTPMEEYTNAAFWVTLPFYGLNDERDKEIAIKERHIHRQVRVLQQCSWKELAKKMRSFDAQAK